MLEANMFAKKLPKKLAPLKDVESNGKRKK
jgi:hypothetical protein